MSNDADIQLKKYNTHKQNNSFNISKLENTCEKILKSIFNNVLTQYKSAKYPFNCDFYIPDLDLYIECNFHWTHGGKLFEGTVEDLNLIEYWRSKNKKYYNNAIETWTIRDVEKFKTAENNNLNYLVFYSIEQFNETINKITINND